MEPEPDILFACSAFSQAKAFIQYDELTLQAYYPRGVILMEENKKKKYEKPKVVEHGAVKDVTLIPSSFPGQGKGPPWSR